jgi:hypothetical protein
MDDFTCWHRHLRWITLPTACPVGINTGDRQTLRAEAIKKSPRTGSQYFALAENAIGWSVRLGHAAEKMIGVDGIKSVSVAVENLTGTTLPKWNNFIPSPTLNLRDVSVLR